MSKLIDHNYYSFIKTTLHCPIYFFFLPFTTLILFQSTQNPQAQHPSLRCLTLLRTPWQWAGHPQPMTEEPQFWATSWREGRKAATCGCRSIKSCSQVRRHAVYQSFRLVVLHFINPLIIFVSALLFLRYTIHGGWPCGWCGIWIQSHQCKQGWSRNS